MADDAPLTSQNTGEAVHAAFDNLSNMFVGSQAQTVEELVKEMLRPMLKAWLDQNLPGMVEQMVQKEIQRVTRPALGRICPKISIRGCQMASPEFVSGNR